MVTHHIRNILYRHLLGGLDPERHPVVRIVAHRVFNIGIGVLGHQIALGLLESEPAVAQDIERAPNPGLASAQSAEVSRTVRVAETELAVLAAEPAL